MNNIFKQGVAAWVCMMIIAAGSGFGASADSPPQATQESPEQLQQLVAPIALYPDSLIAQILPAATYPDQVLEADKWMEQSKNLQGGQLATEVDKQDWDQSVKALTQFPAVLGNMRRNLAWTSELGDAYLNQQQDLSQAIQTMRDRAKQAGNLNTTVQQTVETKGKTLVIEPTQTDVVYVPEYDPWLAYGAPLAVFPGWYWYPGLYWESPGIGFGLAFQVGRFGGYGWGWRNWDFDWRRGGRVVYNHNTYISHSRTIVDRNHFRPERPSPNQRQVVHGADRPHTTAGMHSGAFSGFNHGGVVRGNASRGQASFRGSHGGGSAHR